MYTCYSDNIQYGIITKLYYNVQWCYFSSMNLFCGRTQLYHVHFSLLISLLLIYIFLDKQKMDKYVVCGGLYNNV